MKITNEISRETLKCLLIASYVAGHETGRLDYTIDHDRVSKEWDNLERLLDNPSLADK